MNKFSAELSDVVKGSVFKPSKKEEACDRDLLKDNSKRYQEIYGYQSQRPTYDASKDQILFDRHMTEF